LILTVKISNNTNLTNKVIELIIKIIQIESKILEYITKPVLYFITNSKNLDVNRLEELLRRIFKSNKFYDYKLDIIRNLILKIAQIKGSDDDYTIKIDFNDCLKIIDNSLKNRFFFLKIVPIYRFLDHTHQ